MSDALAAPVENRSKGADGVGGAAAVIEFFAYDECRFVELVAAEGLVDLGAGEFRSNASLSSATLNATVQLFDQVSSTTIPVTLALTWSGIGDIIRINSRQTLRFGGSSYASRQSGSIRDAAASGTFLVGTTNYAAGPVDFANLTSSNNGTVSLNQ